MDKRYYWLKLNKDFFDLIRMKKLQRVAGAEGVLLYEKLLLVAMNSSGKILFEGVEDTIENELAVCFGEDSELTTKTIDCLIAVGLCERDGQNLFFPEAVECVGSETKDAERKRDQRKRTTADNTQPLQDSERTDADSQRTETDSRGQCPENVQKCPDKSGQSRTMSDREKREDIEIEKETETERESPPKPPSGGSATRTPYRAKISSETLARFERFWQHYPNKKARAVAMASFGKINPDDELTNRMIRAVEEQRLSDQWTRDAGQYIPYPATWLNQRRWEDSQDAIAIPQKENPFLQVVRRLEAEEGSEHHDENRNSETVNTDPAVLSALPF